MLKEFGHIEIINKTHNHSENSQKITDLTIKNKIFDCLTQESHLKLLATNQMDEDLWRDPTSARWDRPWEVTECKAQKDDIWNAQLFVKVSLSIKANKLIAIWGCLCVSVFYNEESCVIWLCCINCVGYLVPDYRICVTLKHLYFWFVVPL